MSEKATVEKYSVLRSSNGGERRLTSKTDLDSSARTKSDVNVLPDAVHQFQNMDASTVRSLAEFENATIQKQRRELQLLVAELRDRDRELNETVAAHQQQIAAWERDRRRIFALDEKCSQLERELQNRTDQVHALRAQLHIVESQESNQRSAVTATQEQLSAISEQHSHALLQQNDLQDRNNRLKQTIQDLRSEFGQYEAREQELLAVQASKDRELSAAMANISELKSKLKISEVAVGDLRATEAKLRQANMDVGKRATDARRETDHVKRDVQRLELHCDELKKEIQRLKLKLLTTGKEIALFGEREKRKDQLLELQRSKQERADAELAGLRELYERQQREMALLQMSVDTSKALIGRQRKCTTMDSQPASASQHVDLSQLVVSSKSITGKESAGQQRKPCPSTFHSGLPDETLITEMLPEKDFCDSTLADMSNTTAACWSVRRTESVPVTSERQTVQSRNSRANVLQEPLSSVSSQSISLQLFSAAGSASSKSSAPASNHDDKSGTDENDGRQNRILDHNSENRHLDHRDHRSDLDHLDHRDNRDHLVHRDDRGHRNHRDAVGGSRDGSSALYNGISSRDTKPDEHFRAITSSAAVVQPPGDVGDQSLDSGGRRCYSAAAVYSLSTSIIGADAVERLYYSAANSVQSNCSSRSLTPAGNSCSSGSSTRDQAQVAKNSFTE